MKDEEHPSYNKGKKVYLSWNIDYANIFRVKATKTENNAPFSLSQHFCIHLAKTCKYAQICEF